MKKQFLLSAALVALALPAQAEDKVKLVISNSQWLDALRGEQLWAVVKAYEKVAPNVVLEQEAIPSKDYADRIMTEFGAGQGPDLAIMQEGVFYALADAGMLVDLADVTEGVALNDTIDNAIVDDVTLGVPWQRAVYAMIYNKELVDQAGASVPTDVEGLIASAKQVQEKTGAIGFTARHQINDFSGWSMDFQNWAYGYGVHWVDDEGELTINTPEAAAAIAAFKEVYDSGIIPIGDDMPTQRTRFKEKQVGFSMDNSGGTLNIASGGAMQSANVMASPLPFPNPAAHQQMFISISANSDHPEEAAAFLKWLISPEGQALMRDASGPDALATDVPVTEEFATVNPWAQTFADLAKSSRSTLIPGHEVETNQIMRPVMQAVEDVLIRGTAPADALAVAQGKIDSMF
ncbi:extracellular solute-binding protein [Paracoccus laeviglucosivorans]|uniref:Carbohydrate ABC transporter substrate-binding protein, CUT1 family n=1 Tax=Paracoccus laeviglucosivorans TaxID=1197861 RepID=A0A521FND6_9RHOB|nr:extracellular solute-binding protein [Paracoccus laeviglucosivorans]SMO97725.1 carbohydrate ABC transporter substrate-binding protein, CUT1 family [Paracoccus laeviglucosivorans]